MQITISNHAQVPHLQLNGGVTKILTVIEPWFPQPYVDPDRDPRVSHIEIYRLAMKDLEVPGDYLAPSLDHADWLLDFTTKLKENDHLLINCWAGKSRSTAAGLIILFRLLGDDVDKAVELLEKIRPQAAPNMLLCSFVDDGLHAAAKRLNAVNNKQFDGT